MTDVLLHALPKCVVAVTGFDGAGKGTVIEQIRCMADKFGLRVLTIGKADTPITETLSAAIQRKGAYFDRADQWCIEAQILARFSRDAQRGSQAREFRGEIVLLDRFVEAALGYAAYHECSSPWFDLLAKKITRGAGLTHVIHCQCRFDVAWERVKKRAYEGIQPMSVKELAGPETVRRLGELAVECFRAQDFKSKLLVINTDESIDNTQRQVAALVEGLIRDLRYTAQPEKSALPYKTDRGVSDNR